jgi:hypothetical protein
MCRCFGKSGIPDTRQQRHIAIPRRQIVLLELVEVIEDMHRNGAAVAVVCYGIAPMITLLPVTMYSNQQYQGITASPPSVYASFGRIPQVYIFSSRRLRVRCVSGLAVDGRH